MIHNGHLVDLVCSFMANMSAEPVPRGKSRREIVTGVKSKLII